MHTIGSFFGNKMKSLGVGGLAALLLVGGAGCIGEGEEDITHVSSALTGPNGHTYTFVSTPRSYADAKSACMNAGAHLATITNATEDAWLLDQERNMFGGGAWWFGYTDSAVEGVWRWDDGMGNGYVNWSPGEPNNQNNEDCGLHNSFTNGKWNDSNCANSFKYVCESGGADTMPKNFAYSATNTNNDTQNFAQWAVDLDLNRIVELTTCSPKGFVLTGDTYLRIFTPWNSVQAGENNNACGTTASQITISGTFNPTGTYIIHGGCAGSGSCNATVNIDKL